MIEGFRTTRLAGLVGVRPGEGSLVARVAFVVAVIEAARGLGEVGADTLLLSRFGQEGLPGVLPFLFIALGVLGLLIAVGYSAALARLPRVPLFVAILALFAATIAGLRAAIADGDPTVVSLLWLAVKAGALLAVTVYWTVAAASFDARQARRLFPLVTAAAIAGSFAGTLAAGPAAAVVGVEDLVLISGVLLVVAAVLLWRLPGRIASRTRSSRQGSTLAGLRSGFDFVARSPLMSRVAIAYVLLAILMFSVDYPFKLAASAAFASPVEVATTLGLLSAAVTGTSFIVSLTLANRLYARFGVTVGALVLPIVYLLGFGLWIVQFSFATAAFVLFAQQVTQRGISNAAWSAFYTTVPADRRAQVLAFNDGVPGPIGTILAGVLLLAAGRILGPEQVFLLGAGTALVATVVVMGIRRRYAESLVAALRAGAGEAVLEGGPGVGALASDPAVGRALLAALRTPEPGAREMAAALLPRVKVAGAERALVDALADEDARVRAAAIRGLAKMDAWPPDTDHPDVAADPSPLVRAAAVVANARRGDQPDPGLLVDPSPEVRAAAIAATRVDPNAESAMLAALGDEAAPVRRAAADALAPSAIDPPKVLGLLHGDSVRAQRAALAALVGIAERDHTVAPAVADWVHRRLVRATGLRDARLVLVASGTSADPVAGFLGFVLGVRQREVEGTVLDALAVLGAPEARGVIRRCLRSDDVEVRAQAMEALDSMGDRRVAGALVRLLESDTPEAAGSADDVLGRLAQDDDVWISALAQSCLGAAGGDAEMARSERTLSDLDTMLLLRTVPLFEGLDPEDLQRIAATSEERIYAGGETILREGDPGDELIVIVAGAVRVMRAGDDGAERFIRRYDAGEHIGELAVLREGPRAATVLAEEGGVRGLVISGEGLKAILYERPAAAMAMLGTLAERISRQ